MFSAVRESQVFDYIFVPNHFSSLPVTSFDTFSTVILVVSVRPTGLFTNRTSPDKIGSGLAKKKYVSMARKWTRLE